MLDVEYQMANPNSEDSILANDMVFQPGFRRGYGGLSREEKDELGIDDDDEDDEDDEEEGSEEASARRVARQQARRLRIAEEKRIADEVYEGEIDWDVEAVADEDDL